MAATKDRYMNPTVGDTIRLRTFVYNSNTPANVVSIDHIDIFKMSRVDCHWRKDEDRYLVQTIPGTDVVQNAEGEYEYDLTLVDPQYTIGKYTDVWFIQLAPEDIALTEMPQLFQVYPQLWYTSPIPIVYDFSFFFQPNRMRLGEQKWIEIEITPNVPRATDLARYYENLIISSTLLVNIEQVCGDCIPEEADLRLVVDSNPVQYKEKNRGYYRIDTTQFDCGIYNLWFELDFGGNVYISPKNQLQIYS